MVVGHVASVAGLEFGPLGFAEEEERGGGEPSQWCLEERRRRVEGSNVRNRGRVDAQEEAPSPVQASICVQTREETLAYDSKKKKNSLLLFILSCSTGH